MIVKREQLLRQGQDLDRRAAFLANRLHDFEDEDVFGPALLLDEIDDTVKDWKQVQGDIAYIHKFGQERPEAKSEIILGNIAEMKLKANGYKGQVRKMRSKIKASPEHKSVPFWEREMAMYESEIKTLETQIFEQYAAEK